MNFSASYFSDKGPREANEDSAGIAEMPGGLAVAIADGLGGHYGGKIASQFAVTHFLERVKGSPACDLRDLMFEIHDGIRTRQLEDTKLRSMATTFSGAIFQDSLMTFAHCGDTRIVASRNGGVRRLTTDHSEAQRLFDTGALTKDELAHYSRKNILESALGIDGGVRIDIGTFNLSRGDRIFFTSDGFHDVVLLRELVAIAASSPTASEASSRLFEEIRTRPCRDNFTCICVYAD